MTYVLSPFFFLNQLIKKRKTQALKFFSLLIFYDAIHFYLGVDLKSFTLSNGLFMLTYFCVVAFWHFINSYSHLGRLYKQILVLNFFLMLMAIPFLFTQPQYQQWFWWINHLTKGITDFPRLKLFTYEASYYALLMVPVFYYYVFKFIFGTVQHHKYVTALMVFMPMILSMSFGVVGATLFTSIILCLVHHKKLLRYKRAFVLSSLVLFVLLVTVFIFIFFFPQHPIVVRTFNILQGNDTSANGRIWESYTAAWRIAGMKSFFFGAGLGQIKIQIVEVVHQYFNYWGNFPRYDIPNTMGETLAIFGITGVCLRIYLEIYLFSKTKVMSNYYRLALFIFAFIYQFTGSFITNIAEYTIWILAFSKVFEQFDVRKEI